MKLQIVCRPEVNTQTFGDAKQKAVMYVCDFWVLVLGIFTCTSQLLGVRFYWGWADLPYNLFSNKPEMLSTEQIRRERTPQLSINKVLLLYKHYNLS